MPLRTITVAATTNSSSDDTHLAASIQGTLDNISTIAQMGNDAAETIIDHPITNEMRLAAQDLINSLYFNH